MKVKLLKKVRKRYDIVKVDRVAVVDHGSLSTTSYLWQSDTENAQKNLGVPFYVITDRSRWNPFRSSHKTKKEALTFLALRIKSDYTTTVKSAKEKNDKSMARIKQTK